MNNSEAVQLLAHSIRPKLMVQYVQFAERVSESQGVLNPEWKETRTSRSVRYDSDGNTVSTIHENPDFKEVKKH